MSGCAWHLPGNRPCPYAPLYVVVWKHNEPAAYRTAPPTFRELARHVCGFHLAPAIDQGLEQSPKGLAVAVSLLPSG